MQISYHKNYNFIEKYQNLNINDCIILSIIFSFTENKREYSGGYLYVKKFIRISERQYYRVIARLLDYQLIIKTNKNVYIANIEKIRNDYLTKATTSKIIESKGPNTKENQSDINDMLDKYNFNEELRATLFQFLKSPKVKNKDLLVKTIFEKLKDYSNESITQLINEMMIEDRHVIYFDRLQKIQQELDKNKKRLEQEKSTPDWVERLKEKYLKD